jgi:hypothetical protein
MDAGGTAIRTVQARAIESRSVNVLQADVRESAP